MPRCTACDYDLRGLPPGARCPECGLPSFVAGGLDDPLSAMPLPVIKAFRRACWTATACLLLVPVIVAGHLWWGVAAGLEAAALLGLSVLWTVAVCLLTPALDLAPATWRGFAQRGRLRRAARWFQGGWILAAAAHALRVVAPALAGWGVMPGALAVVSGAGVVAGVAGIIALSLLLQELAEWTCDREAQAAFNLAVWTVAVASVLFPPMAAVASRYAGTPLAAIAITFGLILLICLAAFPYALVSLSRSITWAVHHAREHQDRLRRRAERDERYTEEAARAAGGVDERPER